MMTRVAIKERRGVKSCAREMSKGEPNEVMAPDGLLSRDMVVYLTHGGRTRQLLFKTFVLAFVIYPDTIPTCIHMHRAPQHLFLALLVVPILFPPYRHPHYKVHIFIASTSAIVHTSTPYPPKSHSCRVVRPFFPTLVIATIQSTVPRKVPRSRV